MGITKEYLRKLDFHQATALVYDLMYKHEFPLVKVNALGLRATERVYVANVEGVRVQVTVWSPNNTEELTRMPHSTICFTFSDVSEIEFHTHMVACGDRPGFRFADLPETDD